MTARRPIVLAATGLATAGLVAGLALSGSSDDSERSSGSATPSLEIPVRADQATKDQNNARDAGNRAAAETEPKPRPQTSPVSAQPIGKDTGSFVKKVPPSSSRGAGKSRGDSAGYKPAPRRGSERGGKD